MAICPSKQTVRRQRGSGSGVSRLMGWAFLAALLAFPGNTSEVPVLSIERIEDGRVRLRWPADAGAYQLEQSDLVGNGATWTVVADPAVAEGSWLSMTQQVAGSGRFYRLFSRGSIPLTVVAQTSPANGSGAVSVTRETIFDLSAPLSQNTVLTTNDVQATFGGRRLLSRIELSADRKRITLFYLQNLPAGARVTVTLNGNNLRDFAGQLVDGDGDGLPGGVKTVYFDTFGSAPVPGTVVVGRVYASELIPDPNNVAQTTNLPLEGVIITVDGAEHNPQLRAVTDANGFFRLDPAPAGTFFVHIDGRTATGSQWPDGAYYPFVGKAWEAAPGRTNLAGGTGEIFLPLIPVGTLQPVSLVQPTTVTFPPSVVSSNPALSGVSVTVPPNSLFSDDGTRGGMVGIAPVSPDRLPSPLPPGLNLPLVITIQTDGPLNFDQPAPVRFPNLPDPLTGERLPPGAKSALWSFNHDTGQWEIVGPMTVTADGNFVETDPGVGVTQPGWHGTQPGTSGDGGNPVGGDSSGDGGTGPDDDGDGVPNDEDDDVDGDGVPNEADDDIDGDGIPNDQDPDDDNDGTPDDAPPDEDGDGIPDDQDPDDDNDGTPDEDEEPCQDGAPECGANTISPVDQSDWPITNNDADPQGNYTRHRGFEIQGGVCYEPASQSWKYRVSRLVWRGSINTSTNSGLISTEPLVGPAGNVTESNYCSIIAEMAGYLGRGRGVWHMRSASLAHEVHHRDVDWPGIANPIWQNIEAAIEAESVPCDRGPAEAQLILEGKVSQALANLQSQFTAGLTAFNAGHDGARNDAAYQAGQSVLNTRILGIQTYATASGWTACPPGRLPASRSTRSNGDPSRIVDLRATVPSRLLRPGQSAQIELTGIRADGTRVTLTTSPGTRYESLLPDVVSVSESGLVTGAGPGATSVNIMFTPGVDGHPLFASVSFTVPRAHDQDHDGMLDVWERANGLNPDDPSDATRDEDRDGLDNRREFDLNTDPRNPDTDGDGAEDEQEVLAGTNPRHPDNARNLIPSSGLHYFVLMNLETGRVEQRGTLGRNGQGHDNLIMSPNSRYRQWIFHAATRRVGTMDWVTPGSGTRFQLPAVVLRRDSSADSDHDGLRDRAEFIIGTNPNQADTDGDGISDGAEVLAGTNPADGLAVSTGVIATGDTPGTAVDVAAANNYVAVADSAAGVAIFNVQSGFNPTLIAQVDTPGNARAVALINRPTAEDILRVAVADGPAGLAVIDLQLPVNARLTRQVNLGGNANCVATLGGLAFVGLESGTVLVVDTAGGSILERLEVRERINDLGIGGDTLFVATQNKLLSYALTDLGAGPLDSVQLNYFPEGLSSRRRLFVGPEQALVTSYPGYDVVSVREPANLSLLGAARDAGPNSFKQIVANGSGLGVAAVGVNPRVDGTHDVWLYDVSDAAQTTRLLGVLTTPGLTYALSLYNGLAYAADGEAGLQVVNYLPYDSAGLPPGISLAADFPLSPAQAEEGKLVRVTATVSDDVQVARVEFYVDGVRLAVDGNFPFEERFITPLRSAAKTHFTLRARAVDTGGNSAWSTEYRVELVPDATPPRVVRKFPTSGAIVGSADTVAAYFSEPIDLATLGASTFQLASAGLDAVLGTSDDLLATAGTLDYRPDLNAAFLRFTAQLTPGLYAVHIRPPLADQAGNPLAAAVSWSFWVLGQTDSDHDGVPDNVEAALGLNANNPDSDGDGILDGNEDLDNDRLRNAWELLFGYDPRVADTDGNGFRDDLEDPDGDGLINLDEARLGANPLNGDTDGDGFDDNGERFEGTDPASASSKPNLLAASTSASFLNAAPEDVPAGTTLTSFSAVASFLNAAPQAIPTGTTIPVFSPEASYLNASAQGVPGGTLLFLASPPAAYLNAEPQGFHGAVFQVSPLVSYENR